MVSSVVTSPMGGGSHKDCGFGVRYTNFMFINKRLAEGSFIHAAVQHRHATGIIPRERKLLYIVRNFDALGGTSGIRTRRAPRTGFADFRKP
jgi:hypothetical protein